VGKLSDFHFEIGAGSSVWTKARHKPLLIFVCLTLSPHRPWKLRGTLLLEELDRKMRELHKTNSRFRGNLLRKRFLQTRKLEGMPDRMVRRMLQRSGEQPIPD
jgi:hypothetical protein